MKIIDYDEYQNMRGSFLETKLSLNLKRAPRRRRRSREERALLLEMDCRRWQKWLATGQLRKLGKRSYSFS